MHKNIVFLVVLLIVVSVVLYFLFRKECFENDWKPLQNNPPGSYLQSCEDVRTEVDKYAKIMKITGRCANTRGEKINTELYIRTGKKICSLDNNDGMLTCSGRRPSQSSQNTQNTQSVTPPQNTQNNTIPVKQNNIQEILRSFKRRFR